MATRPTIPSNADRAIAIVTQRQVWLEPEGAFVRNEVAVFGGTFFTVTFTSKKEQRMMDNFVFFDGKMDHYFNNPSEFARFIDSIKSTNYSSASSLLRELAVTGGAPSLIAVIITLTICFLSVNSHTIPDILGNALATILGFYFGSKITASKSTDHGKSSSGPAG